MNYDCIFPVCFSLLSLSEDLCVLRELLVFSTLLLGGLTSEKLAGSSQMRAQHQMLSGSVNAHGKKMDMKCKDVCPLKCTDLCSCISQVRDCLINTHYPSLWVENVPSCSNFNHQWNFFIYHSVIAVWKRQCRSLVIWWLNLMNIIRWIIPEDWLESLISLPKSSVTFLRFCGGALKLHFLPFLDF